MEGFVCQLKEFVLYTKLDREPVKVDEGWGDVLPGLSLSETPGS